MSSKITVFWDMTPYSFVDTVKREAAGSSDTLLSVYKTTWRHISEGSNRRCSVVSSQSIRVAKILSCFTLLQPETCLFHFSVPLAASAENVTFSIYVISSTHGTPISKRKKE